MLYRASCFCNGLPVIKMDSNGTTRMESNEVTFKPLRVFTLTVVEDFSVVDYS